MTPTQFDQLAQQAYNRIPIVREVLADLDTPLSAYLKLAKGPYSYLFESVEGGEKWGRYSFIGLPAKTVIKVIGSTVYTLAQGQLIEQIEVDDPLTWVADFQQSFHVPEVPELARFTGGLVGYFGYDIVRYVEPRLAKSQLDDPLGTPDILLMLSEEVLVFDNLRGKLYFVVHANPEESDALSKAQQRLDNLVEQLRNTPLPAFDEGTPHTICEEDFVSSTGQASFEKAVEKAKAYIVDGDAMQVVLSQRLSVPCSAPPINVYRTLRFLNPSPYMFFLDLDEFHIVGSSPEILVRLESNEITVRPIAGTRPRGKTNAEDKALEEELLADPKERAEHLMLIDLGRNDIGRVANIGSVKLTENMIVERYSHVMHIVSNVMGQLQPTYSAIDVLKATFPAGTLSGAPKIRAMEIIGELEPIKRGVYGGAVGYLSWYGDMDTAIAIRTAVIKDKTLSIQVGAGIVADSVPEKEWQETMNKGRAMFRAVAVASEGLASKDYQTLPK